MPDMVITSTNPGRNYEVLGQVAMSSSAEIAAAVAAARTAQPAWQALGVQERVRHLTRVQTVFEKHGQRIAESIAQEMGMPVEHAKGSNRWTQNHMRWQLAQAEKCLAPVVTYEDAEELHLQTYEPHGVAAVIAPWNFPQSNFVSGAFQPLLAGNTVVYKVSEEVPLFGRLLDQLLAEAKLPPGVFSQVYGDGAVGEALARSAIDALFFTGSTKVGHKLYQIAAEKFIPAHLELGGSDAGIVCEDADLTTAIPQIYDGKFCNNGQICCGLKRLLVHEALFDKVVQQLAAYVRSKTVGDPLSPTTDLGPLAAKRQLDLLKAQVEDARQLGVTVVTGGKEPPGLQGAYYEPTLLTAITPAMRVWREEVFGPVLPIVPYRDEAEALRLANETPYGLSAYVYTQDQARAKRLAAGIVTRSVSHNGVDFSAPHNPFGGAKRSGLKKTAGVQGFHDACRVKIVSLRK